MMLDGDFRKYETVDELEKSSIVNEGNKNFGSKESPSESNENEESYYLAPYDYSFSHEDSGQSLSLALDTEGTDGNSSGL